jgi:hypothetical protein
MLRFVLVYFRALTKTVGGYTQHGCDIAIERRSGNSPLVGCLEIPRQAFLNSLKRWRSCSPHLTSSARDHNGQQLPVSILKDGNKLLSRDKAQRKLPGVAK